MAGIAELRAVIIDCPDPLALAQFYGELVGGEIEDVDPAWVKLRDGDRVYLSFQGAPDHQPPEWPNPDKPQQFHVDVTIDLADLDAAEAAVLALGARKHELQPGEDEGWRVYLDPAGHPFCLCWD
jgi:hypothetical protein